MKAIHQINIGFFAFTAGLYLTIYLGLLAQIILGVIQLTIGLYLVICKYNSIQRRSQIHLKAYWTITLVYLASLFFVKDLSFDSTPFWVLYLMVAPMAIATYFTTLVYQLYKKTTVTPSIH